MWTRTVRDDSPSPSGPGWGGVPLARRLVQRRGPNYPDRVPRCQPLALLSVMRRIRRGGRRTEDGGGIADAGTVCASSGQKWSPGGADWLGVVALSNQSCVFAGRRNASRHAVRLHFKPELRERPDGRGVSCGRYGAVVPRLSAFHGIVIYMYIRDHGVGHFHACYGEHEAVLSVASAELLEGRLPRRQLGMVREWAQLHQPELVAAWQKASLGEAPGTIEPLP